MTATVSSVLLSHYRGDDARLESDEYYEAKLETYREAWRPWERPIIEELYRITGLHYYLPVIDVTFAPMVPNFSTPLQLNYKQDADNLIDSLTHELIHVLLSDNKEKVSLGSYFEMYWPQRPPKVKSHILVHAFLAHIFIEVMKQPDRMERDKRDAAHNPPYVRAWEIVEAEGYRSIIETFRTYIDEERGRAS